MIWWNGISSDDLHLYVERYPSRTFPTRKTTFYSVPGRSGDFVYQENAWENYTQAYEIYISAEQRKLPNAMVAINAWLYGPNGYAKLEDSYDIDTYRMATFVGGQEITNSLNRFGRATIEFNCKPQRWLKSGEEEINLLPYFGENELSIKNPTGLIAKPMFRFSGSGSLNVYAYTTDYRGSSFEISDVNDVWSVDFETLSVSGRTEAYKSIDTFDFELPPKDFKMWYDGDQYGEPLTLNSITMEPRWFTL